MPATNKSIDNVQEGGAVIHFGQNLITFWSELAGPDGKDASVKSGKNSNKKSDVGQVGVWENKTGKHWPFLQHHIQQALEGLVVFWQ